MSHHPCQLSNLPFQSGAKISKQKSLNVMLCLQIMTGKFRQKERDKIFRNETLTNQMNEHKKQKMRNIEMDLIIKNQMSFILILLIQKGFEANHKLTYR